MRQCIHPVTAPAILSGRMTEGRNERNEMREKDGSWRDGAACIGVTADVFFPEESGNTSDRIYDQARLFCAACPVTRQCLEEAMQYEVEEWRRFGCWGGLSPREREALSKKRGGVQRVL